MSTGCRNALPGPWTASSVAPVPSGYGRALRPCHEPAIAPRQRVSHSEPSFDWLATCRAARDDVRAVLAELPTRAAREPVVGAGQGGDDTTAVDAAAEAAIVRLLEQTGEDFLLVSEELGERRF